MSNQLVSAHIKRVITGEVRHIPQEFPDVGTALFQYAHGNYSCDCNRAVFFHRKYPYELPCSDGLYQVNLWHGGECIHQEFDEYFNKTLHKKGRRACK